MMIDLTMQIIVLLAKIASTIYALGGVSILFTVFKTNKLPPDGFKQTDEGKRVSTFPQYALIPILFGQIVATILLWTSV